MVISVKLGEVMSKRKGRHEETLENCRQFGNSHNRECTFQKIFMVMDFGTKCMKVDEI